MLAYPRGRFNDEVVKAVERAGYKEARTTHVLSTAPALDPLRMPTTIHAFNGRKEYSGRPWRVMADFYLEHAIKNSLTFHLWGHSFELERDKLWDELDAFLGKIKTA